MSKRFGKLHRMCQSAVLSDHKPGLDYPDGGRVFLDKIIRAKALDVMARFTMSYAVSAWDCRAVGEELLKLKAVGYKLNPEQRRLVDWFRATESGEQAQKCRKALVEYMARGGYNYSHLKK